jgi:hypothetical protein
MSHPDSTRPKTISIVAAFLFLATLIALIVGFF